MPIRFGAPTGSGVVSLRSYIRGAQGAAATIAVGTVTELDPGSTPTVSNAGTSAAASFNFGLPGSPTVAVNSTETINEGESAAVSNSGDEYEVALDFDIPRGAMPATSFNFNTATTDSDKDAGDVWFNNAAPASVTVIYFDNADRNGNSVTSWLDSLDDSTSTIKGTITLVPAATPSDKLIYNVTGSVVDGTGYRKVTVTHVSGATLPSDNAQIGVVFSRTGNDGVDGSMSGPVTSTDNAIARFDGADGATLQNSGVIVDDSNNISGVAAASVTTIELGHASDTTIARSAAGKATIEGNLIAAIADPNADRVLIWDDSAGDYVAATLNAGLEISGTTIRATEPHGIALSDETTTITTGTNKATFSLPYAFTVTSVYATLNTVSSSGAVTVDINEAGTTILSTKLTIDQSEKTSGTAATPAVISDASIAANAEIGFDIDGAGTGAKGLKVFIQGYRT